MEFTEYVEIIQRRWKVVAAAVLLGVLIAFLSTLGRDDSDDVATFKASHTLVVDTGAQVEGSPTRVNSRPRPVSVFSSEPFSWSISRWRPTNTPPAIESRDPASSVALPSELDEVALTAAKSMEL